MKKENNNHAFGNGNGTISNRIRRANEAKERQKKCANRTPEQQFEKLDAGGFKAVRERHRLITEMATGSH